MKTAKEIKKELENDFGWDFSEEDKQNMETYYELFLDVQSIVLFEHTVSNCSCSADETTGWIEVRCCNICGKPIKNCKP